MSEMSSQKPYPVGPSVSQLSRACCMIESLVWYSFHTHTASPTLENASRTLRCATFSMIFQTSSNT